MTAKGRKTTPSRPRKRTVAKPATPEHFATHPDDPATPYYDARDDQGEFAVEPPVETPETPTAPVVVADPSDQANGFCDNHRHRPAVLMTSFRWTPTQRFCAQCVPEHYRSLL